MNPLLQSVRGWLNAGLAFVYPEVCQVCHQARATPDECFICSSCRGSIHRLEPPFCARCGAPFQGAITQSFECGRCRDTERTFRYARATALLGEQLLGIIHQYKYNRALWFEPFLANLLLERAVPELRREDWDCIVPVPLYPAKQREREFNQAERLARHLSEATTIPLNRALLRRVRPTQSQTRLTRDERLENVRRAFAMQRTQRLNGERIVVVDDVFTTGATTGACARVLRAAGAADVCVWTVARGV